MNWTVPTVWKNSDVWILGGGSSILNEFAIPTQVSQKVLEGTLPVSTYSPYMEPIHAKHVIGVNAAYLIGTWMDIIFFGDTRFFDVNAKNLFAYPGLLVSSAVKCERVGWVKYVAQDKSYPFGISKDPTKVSWNGNSGAAAISIAANAGAKRIFLLGFDMSTQNRATHFHSEYKRISTKREPPYLKHLKGFPKIAEDARKRGIEIYNVSMNSAITAFPKLTLKEALEL